MYLYKGLQVVESKTVTVSTDVKYGYTKLKNKLKKVKYVKRAYFEFVKDDEVIQCNGSLYMNSKTFQKLKHAFTLQVKEEPKFRPSSMLGVPLLSPRDFARMISI